MSPVDADHFRALFEPRGVVVAGASSHPGKFGFVALHNILSQGYAGGVYATNREGGTILGVDTVPGIDDLPADATVDLAFVCTPAAANPELLRACARAGHQGRVHHQRGLRRGGRRRQSRGARARRPRATSSTSCSPGRTDKASSARRRRCARRSSPRTRRPARSGSRARAATSSRASSTTRCRPGSGSAERSAPATPRWRRCPTTSTSTPTTPRPRSGSRTWRASPTVARSPTASAP